MLPARIVGTPTWRRWLRCGLTCPALRAGIVAMVKSANRA